MTLSAVSVNPALVSGIGGGSGFFVGPRTEPAWCRRQKAMGHAAGREFESALDRKRDALIGVWFWRLLCTLAALAPPIGGKPLLVTCRPCSLSFAAA